MTKTFLYDVPAGWLALISASFLLGYGTKSKNRNITIVIAFALMTSLVLYLIMELDRPRRGIINIDAAERTIVDLESKF